MNNTQRNPFRISMRFSDEVARYKFRKIGKFQYIYSTVYSSLPWKILKFGKFQFIYIIPVEF